MPIFKRRRRDDQFYVHQGYPMDLEENEQIPVATWTVCPRAEIVFNRAGFRDGQEVPEELFYAVVVEGSLTLPSHEQPPKIWAVPRAIRDEADSYQDRPGTNRFLRNHPGFQYVSEFFRRL